MGPSVKEQYDLQMHKLKFNSVDGSMLSEHQMYIISTPITVYLWVGKELE